MAEHENEGLRLTFEQLCAYTEAARQSDPYQAPEVVLGEWLALAGITPEPSALQAAAERVAIERLIETAQCVGLDLAVATTRECTRAWREHRSALLGGRCRTVDEARRLTPPEVEG